MLGRTVISRSTMWIFVFRIGYMCLFSIQYLPAARRPCCIAEHAQIQKRKVITLRTFTWFILKKLHKRENLSSYIEFTRLKACSGSIYIETGVAVELLFPAAHLIMRSVWSEKRLLKRKQLIFYKQANGNDHTWDVKKCKQRNILHAKYCSSY